MATSFQKFRIWKENVLEELYRKYQGKTIKDDYGKNSKEFIDFTNDLRGEKQWFVYFSYATAMFNGCRESLDFIGFLGN